MIPALLFVALYLVSRETSWGARGASPANREGIGTAAFASFAARATKLLSRETPVRELARRLYFFRETTQVKFLEASLSRFHRCSRAGRPFRKLRRKIHEPNISRCIADGAIFEARLQSSYRRFDVFSLIQFGALSFNRNLFNLLGI